MNQKHSDLLRILQAAGGPVTAAELARALQVSVRSVKSYVSQLHAAGWAIQAGKQGYSLPAGGNTPAPGGTAPPYEERAVCIIKRLLIERRYVDIYTLADELFISDTTCRTDFSRMNKTYGGFGLRFAVEQDYPQIKGAEKDKRKLIRHVLSQEAQGEFLSVSRMQGLFPDVDVERLHGIVQRVLVRHGFAVNDFSGHHMLFNITVALIRVGSSKYLGPTLPSTASHGREHAAIAELAAEIEEAFAVRLNGEEQDELYFLLLTGPTPLAAQDAQTLAGFAGEALLGFLHRSLAAIKQQYCVNFDTPAFFTPFCLHVKKLLLRTGHGQALANPLAGAMRRQYPLIYDIAIYFYALLREGYGVQLTEDEIAYFAIHFGGELERQASADGLVKAALLCPAYLDVQEKLAGQIQAEFAGKLQLTQTVSDAADIAPDTGLILSTLPLAGTLVPVVEVSLFLTSDDKVRIFYAVQQLLEASKTPSINEVLAQYFSQELFFPAGMAETREECIAFLCAQLAQGGYAGPEFYAGVMQREQLSSTAFHSLAIPHSLTAGAHKTGICVYLPKTPLAWGSNRVDLVLLAAVAPQDRRAFSAAYDAIVKAFSDFGLLRRLRECKTFAEFAQQIGG